MRSPTGQWGSNIMEHYWSAEMGLGCVLSLCWPLVIHGLFLSVSLRSRVLTADNNGWANTWEAAIKACPSKHKTFVWYLYNVGPTSKTLGRRCSNVIQMFCICWVHSGGSNLHFGAAIASRLQLSYSPLSMIVKDSMLVQRWVGRAKSPALSVSDASAYRRTAQWSVALCAVKLTAEMCSRDFTTGTELLSRASLTRPCRKTVLYDVDFMIE